MTHIIREQLHSFLPHVSLGETSVCAGAHFVGSTVKNFFLYILSLSLWLTLGTCDSHYSLEMITPRF